MKLIKWQDPKKELGRRLASAKSGRKEVERQWQVNERACFRKSRTSFGSEVLPGDVVSYPAMDPDGTMPEAEVNYVFRNLRFIHAQLSANPPSVTPQPTSNDFRDRRRADAADRLVRYFLRQYSLQDRVDAVTLNVLTYGVGFIKHYWDAERGDVLGIDERTGELELEGDLCIKPISPWAMYPDPDADCWEEVNWVFEELRVPWDEACSRWPEWKDVLKKFRYEGATPAGEGDRSSLEREIHDSVLLYQYWERGLPHNGYLGRYAICTPDGQPMDDVRANPHRFTIAKPDLREWPEDRELPKKAELPYSYMGDIDVPHSLWKKSFVEYAAPMQRFLNEIDDVTIENLRAHGVARAIIPEGSEVTGMTDSTWDVMTISGINAPYFMSPPQAMPEMHMTRGNMKAGIDDLSGINESMLGQQSRETSGFSMQYATNQGNLIRRRLFNQYVSLVEAIYRHLLRLVIENWEEPRTIKVLGKGKAFEVIPLQGTDVDGGYDLVVQYGTSLSLDPISRREEILTLMPLFEKAEVDPRKLLEMMRLNELSGMFDELQLASDRQAEIFEEMIEREIYIEPRELEDHQNMLKFAYRYVMDVEYKYLPEGHKALIDQHIKDREELVAQRGAEAAGGDGAAEMPLGDEPAMSPQPMDGTEAAIPDMGPTPEII